jgi:hypothetical protein
MAHPLRGTLVSCPICRAKFDWAYHKKYCSYSCQREKKKQRDREITKARQKVPVRCSMS